MSMPIPRSVWCWEIWILRHCSRKRHARQILLSVSVSSCLLLCYLANFPLDAANAKHIESVEAIARGLTTPTRATPGEKTLSMHIRPMLINLKATGSRYQAQPSFPSQTSRKTHTASPPTRYTTTTTESKKSANSSSAFPASVLLIAFSSTWPTPRIVPRQPWCSPH